MDNFGTVNCEDWAKKRKVMVLSVHMSEYMSGASRGSAKVDTGICLNAVMRFVA